MSTRGGNLTLLRLRTRYREAHSRRDTRLCSSQEARSLLESSVVAHPSTPRTPSWLNKPMVYHQDSQQKIRKTSSKSWLAATCTVFSITNTSRTQSMKKKKESNNIKLLSRPTNSMPRSSLLIGHRRKGLRTISKRSVKWRSRRRS